MLHRILNMFKRSYIIREDESCVIVYKRNKNKKDILKINKITLGVSVE